MSENTARAREKLAMFVIGTINRMPYVIGLASAKAIVEKWNQQSYVSLVMCATTLSGLFARFLNTWFVSLNIKYEVTFAMNAIIGIVGLLGCGFAPYFWLILPAVFMLGFSSYFGEALMLCFCSNKKPTLLNFWSSGIVM